MRTIGWREAWQPWLGAALLALFVLLGIRGLVLRLHDEPASPGGESASVDVVIRDVLGEPVPVRDLQAAIAELPDGPIRVVVSDESNAARLTALVAYLAWPHEVREVQCNRLALDAGTSSSVAGTLVLLASGAEPSPGGRLVGHRLLILNEKGGTWTRSCS